MGEFETGMSINGQTREYVLLAYNMGVKQLIVAVNKMDAEDVSYSEDRFHKIKTEVSSFIIKVGYQPEHVAFVPISARYDDNLFEVSDRMLWFQGWTLKRKQHIITDKTLLEALDAIIVPQQPMDKPFRLPVQDIYEIAGVGTVVVGRVETGVLKLNMVVRFAPPNITATVQSIEMHRTLIESKSIFSKSSEVIFICRGHTW
jgi:elongation factor 1-alpha